MTIASTYPATGGIWARYDELTPEQLETKVARAASVAAELRTQTFAERAAVCRRAAEMMDDRVGDLARLAVREMGKTLASAEAEVGKCARGLRYYADHAERFLADEPADASSVGASRAWVRWEPLGVVLAVMPWNYPFWQALRFLAPAFMAGNVSLLKHASNVPGCALAIEELFTDAGAPDGAVQALLVPASAVDGLIGDPRIAAVTLTGSEAAGRAVGESAGRAIKKVVLELGGSDPFIVLPSADVATAATVAVSARFQNGGQSCIAAKRFIVHQDAGGFLPAFVAATEKLVVGDPMSAATDVGPLATSAAAADLQSLVDDAVAHGANLECGGQLSAGAGWFYPPTVLSGVTSRMRLFREEAFGPVAAVMEVESLDQAVRLANATAFGLAASVWTTDEDEQDRLIRELEAGAVFVNGMTASYPELPFGGIKTSGHGRELSHLGIREFCNAKTVWQA